MQEFCEKATIDFITQEFNALDFLIFGIHLFLSFISNVDNEFFCLFSIFWYPPGFKVILLKYRNLENSLKNRPYLALFHGVSSLWVGPC